MLIPINENICFSLKNSLTELSLEDFSLNAQDYSEEMCSKLGFQELYISIKNHWYRAIPVNEFFHMRNNGDGYYRAVYIQINTITGEYYIGKLNRPRWCDVKRYRGSRLKFKNKFNNHKNEFIRYFIASCKTAKETEEIESSIVNQDLLSDEKCLNLVAGGGGTSEHPSAAETSDKKRQYMKAHPEQYKPMLEGAKKYFQSGNTPELIAKNKRVKETMNTDKYREMTRKRIRKWIAENPEEYAKSRENCRNSIRTKECQEKRKASLEEWKKENPGKYKEWQEKLIKSRTSEESKEKRKVSMKAWKDNNPEQARMYSQKRAQAAAKRNSKAICMLDLETGEVIQKFDSQHDAARWLVDNGKTKNINCFSAISEVCLKKPCTSGYGYRKKAYGYSWCFAEDTKEKG